MRLNARTTLARTFPVIHARLIDAETRHNEHAYLNGILRRLWGRNAACSGGGTRAHENNVKLYRAIWLVLEELRLQYQPRLTRTSL